MCFPPTSIFRGLVSMWWDGGSIHWNSCTFAEFLLCKGTLLRFWCQLGAHLCLPNPPQRLFPLSPTLSPFLDEILWDVASWKLVEMGLFFPDLHLVYFRALCLILYMESPFSLQLLSCSRVRVRPVLTFLHSSLSVAVGHLRCSLCPVSLLHCRSRKLVGVHHCCHLCG